MATQDNTGLGLIKATIERAQNEKSLFNSALKKLVNSSEEELDDFLKRKIEKHADILRLISGGSTLIIKALDGSRLIYNAKDTFESGIDGDFVKWGVNNPGIATSETLMQVHEMVGDGKFMDIFKALPGTWNQKWISQNQVIEFCEKLPDWLKQGGNATFFLIKKDENKPIDENNPEDNLVVANVYVYSGGLRVLVYRLERDDVWTAGRLPRVVVPQLKPSVA